MGDVRPVTDDCCATCSQPKQLDIWMPRPPSGNLGWRRFHVECACEQAERERRERAESEARVAAQRARVQRTVGERLWVPRPSDARLADLRSASGDRELPLGLRAALGYSRRSPRGGPIGLHFVCPCRRRAELYAKALLATAADAGAIVGALRLSLWLATAPAAAESLPNDDHLRTREAAASVEVLALLDFSDHPNGVEPLHALANLLQRRLDAGLTTHLAGPRAPELWLRDFPPSATFRRQAAERVCALLSCAARPFIEQPGAPAPKGTTDEHP